MLNDNEMRIKIRPAKRSNNGVGFVWGIKVFGDYVAQGWAASRAEARRAAVQAAESLGLVTDGVDMAVRA